MKIAVISLSGCTGCQQSLINSWTAFRTLVPNLEVIYWPALISKSIDDLKSIPDYSIDIGIIEGALRTSWDRANTFLLRKKSKKILSLGSCSTMGGIPGLANLEDLDEENKIRIETLDPPLFPEKVIIDVPSLIKVDISLTGCPPVSGNILGAIAKLVEEINFELENKKSSNPYKTIDRNSNFCDICPRESCLLDGDKICFGSISAIPIENQNSKESIKEHLSKNNILEELRNGKPILGGYGATTKVDKERAGKLFNFIVNHTANKKEINQYTEAIELLIPNIFPMGFLTQPDNPIFQLQINGDEIPIKKISNLMNKDKKDEILAIKLPDYLPKETKDILSATLFALKNNMLFKNSAQTVCSSCLRNTNNKEIVRFKADSEEIPDAEKCLLIQGYVCLGPLTKAGCGSTCPKANTPCLGCYGPAINVNDFAAKALSALPAMCTDEPENIKGFFKDIAGLFNRFTVVKSHFTRKIRENVDWTK